MIFNNFIKSPFFIYKTYLDLVSHFEKETEEAALTPTQTDQKKVTREVHFAYDFAYDFTIASVYLI